MIDERPPNFQRETWQTSVSEPSKRMVGSCTASSIASASRKSFLFTLEKSSHMPGRHEPRGRGPRF